MGLTGRTTGDPTINFDASLCEIGACVKNRMEVRFSSNLPSCLDAGSNEENMESGFTPSLPSVDFTSDVSDVCPQDLTIPK
jgi:hypothetical protein